MKKFTTHILPIGFLMMLCFSIKSYGQQPQILETQSYIGHLVRITPKLADIDRTSMYGKPFVRTRDKDGVIGIGARMEEVEERLEEQFERRTEGMSSGAVQKSGTIFPNVPGTSLGVNFDGQQSPGLSPTDNNLCVGPNHIIQMVNDVNGAAFTIWNKAGAVVQARTILASITGFPGFGDPVCLYDQLADRWFLCEFGPNTLPIHNLNFAVSVTNNPTGAWKIYQYTDLTFFIDYHKFSVWHNGYYGTSNDFNNAGSAYLGSSVYSMDRAAMLAGLPTAMMIRTRLNDAGQNFYNMGTIGLEGMTPSTQNGLFSYPIAPTTLNIFEVTPNFVAGTQVVGPNTALPITAYAAPPGAVPQQGGGTAQTLGERMMFKLNYRNNGGTESAVMTHSVGVGGLAAVRWYELRRVAGNWTVFQQGTLANPDGNSRWMGGISMDGCGNIALMYDKSGATANPSMMYTGRNASDPLGTMTLPEQTIINGASPHAGNARWGDYNTTVQDYTAPNVPNNGSFWSTSQYGNQLTRIANFSLTGGCAATPNITAGTATLTAEGCVPNNSVIDPGETVTVSFCVSNVGTLPTANLIGTMQATGGVTPISGPQNYGIVINGGPAVCRSFSFSNTSGTCGGTITVSIQMQDGANNLGTVSWTFTLGTTVVTSSQNFDAVVAPALPAGWIATNVAGPAPLWVTSSAGVPAPPVVSAPNALFVDNPTVVSDKQIVTPSFTPASGARVSFANNYNLETNWDGGVLEISINGGAYQDIITAGGSWVTGGYNITLNASGNPLASRPAWSGSSGGFITSTANLPAASVGQPCQLKFRMGSDASLGIEGWRVDNYSISQPSCCGAVCSITCPPNQTVNTGPGATTCGINVTFPNAGTTGLCGPVTYTPANGSFFPRGTTTVTASTGAGPSCTFTVTVIDNTVPVITCPANITRNNDAGLCSAVVTYTLPTITDNCPGPYTLTQTAGLASGATYPVGVTTNTFRATDVAGNISTCSFTVTVVDNQPPAVTCPVNITRNTDPGVCTATIATPNPTTSDNCAVTTVTWVMTGATTGSSPAAGINFVGTRAFNLNGTTGSGVTTITYTVKDAAGNTTTCSFTVTVNDLVIPVIGGQPTNQFVCVGSNGAFTVTATSNGGPLAYQWQTWTPPAGPWVNIPGATAATLPLPAVPFSLNTTDYRVILTGLCSIVTSNFATLYVNPLPTISLLASRPLALLPGQDLTITAVVVPVGGTFVWRKNGVVIAASGATLSGLTVDDIGSYTATYTDPNGCVATSGAMVVTGQPSDKIWVYPNPNLGVFQVRFYNAVNEKVNVNIFNSAGQKVWSKAMTTGLPYTKIDVDISNLGSDTYTAQVVNSAGKIVGARKFILAKN